MLSEIYIKNIAIIDEISISFGEGLNILSGETGAGKSIIIDSINFVLGERASKDIIKHGKNEAFVSALMNVESENAISAIRDMGVEMESGGELLLSRSINTSGRNTCKINGRPASVTMLKSISSLLIDIHGQHQHQSLLDPKRHIGLLDIFCGDELQTALSENERLFKKFKDSRKQLAALSGLGKDRETAISILEFQINEIDEAKIKVGEEQKLKEKQAFLFNAAKIKELSNNIINLLYRSEGSAAEKIGDSVGMLMSLAKLDNSVNENIASLEDISDRLSTITEIMRDYAEKADVSDNELAEVDRRIEKIKRITAKYGGNEEECLKFYNEASEKLQAILDSEEKAKEINKVIASEKKEIYKTCLKISEIRQKYAEKIEKEIEENLHQLGMENAAFKINISRRRTFDKSGMDEVEFFIRTNKGEDLKRLAEIASGGEMSRVMLSIKSALAGCDDIETFIFDEIDTGISGRTAQQVAVRMSALAKTNQILCITHLPQICAVGDNNYLIEKIIENDETKTIVKKLDEESIIGEIARLTGGAEITDATLIAAKDLRNGKNAVK